MRKKVVGIVVCSLLFLTVFSASTTAQQKTIPANDSTGGVKGIYKSVNALPSPDGKSYRCLMFCENHEQTLEWISLINASGFEKAWQKKFIELTIVLLLPGSILLFGLNDFRNWYMELALKLKYRTEFLTFLQSYDIVNGSGMITYLWLSGTLKRPVDFKAQPDNSWVETSWVLDNSGAYIPNPEIWGTLYFWYFDIPLKP
jgi:hypothetical protein